MARKRPIVVSTRVTEADVAILDAVMVQMRAEGTGRVSRAESIHRLLMQAAREYLARER